MEGPLPYVGARSRAGCSQEFPWRASDSPTLLSGGNPQIPTGDGDASVQAWIEAAPGWKGEVARELDALVERMVPDARKAVKWNSPLYGVEGQGLFLGLHCLTKYVKLAFFRGTQLSPLPPAGSMSPDARYAHIYEGEELDVERLASWIVPAAARPGWVP